MVIRAIQAPWRAARPATTTLNGAKTGALRLLSESRSPSAGPEVVVPHKILKTGKSEDRWRGDKMVTAVEHRAGYKRRTPRTTVATMALSLQRELNRLFDDFLFPEGGERPFARFAPTNDFWTPRIDVTEDDKQIRINAELPGVPKEKINIDMDNDVLTIAGESEEQKDVNDRGVRIRERRYGRFERHIDLPTAVDYSKAEAKMSNGILNVTIPKAPNSQPKHVDII